MKSKYRNDCDLCNDLMDEKAELYNEISAMRSWYKHQIESLKKELKDIKGETT